MERLGHCFGASYFPINVVELTMGLCQEVIGVFGQADDFFGCFGASRKWHALQVNLSGRFLVVESLHFLQLSFELQFLLLDL